MLIKEVSKRTGFSKDTIRYYEKIGLLELDKNGRSTNNYRHFGKKQIKRLLQIKSMKQFGFTLKEIKNLIKLDENKLANCDSLARLADEKIRVVEQKIKELNKIKSKLLRARESCRGDCREIIK